MAKKIPLRQCLGCNEMIPKKELIRIVKDNENNRPDRQDEWTGGIYMP